MPSTDPAAAPTPAAPALLDVVTARHIFEPHHSHPGVVIDIFAQPHIKHGDRYRVEFRGGITEWFWRDELKMHPWTAERDIVHTDLAAVRTILHHAITTAEGHDVLHTRLGAIFDALTAIASTYLGGPLDAPTDTSVPRS